MRQKLTELHDRWFEEGAEEYVHFGYTWYAMWRAHACTFLRFIGA